MSNQSKKVNLALVTTAALALGAPTLSWARTGKGLVLMHRPHPSFKEAPTPLLYRGGPVLSNAKVVAVIWGPKVNSVVQKGIAGMFQATLNSSYMDFMSEYSTNISSTDGREGTHQTIGRGSFVGTVGITPSLTQTTITDQQIGEELESQVQAGHLPRPDQDTLYMNYFPPGVTINLNGALSCQVFCGYHSTYQSHDLGLIYYGVIADLGGNCSIGCGGSPSLFNNVTMTTSHELAELITDPAVRPTGDPGYPDAWNTADGQEIGDLCNGSPAKLTTTSGTTSWLQAEFDNHTMSCAAGPFKSP